MKEKKPILCIDFDGVLNTYDGWRGEDDLFSPRENAKEFLEYLRERYFIVIFTVRPADKVRDWMKFHGLYFDDITNEKIGAVAYIDDRALKFNGNFHDTINELQCFKTHWETKQHYF